MTVGFYLVDAGTVDAAFGRVCAEALTRSVRGTMPGVHVVQLTDESTREAKGVDEVRRLPAAPMAVLRIQHQGAVAGDWLFLDTDIIIQHDIRDVFSQPFDVGITTRNWPHLRVAAGFSERMPFNVGVVFSRSQAFWQEALDRLLRMPPELQHWMGDQQAVCDILADSPKYHVAFFDGRRYNFPPALQPDKAAAKMERKALILHYKGIERKSLLLERIRKERAACA